MTIIDPFAGSGTTCLACEERGVPWVGIELDADYCKIIEQRLSGRSEPRHKDCAKGQLAIEYEEVAGGE